MKHYLNPESAAAVKAQIQADRDALAAKRAQRLARYSQIATETATAAWFQVEQRETFQVGTLRLSADTVAKHFAG